LTERPLFELIEGCRQGKEAAMKAFYERFHGYALSVCLAYTNSREDACEILNDGFMKAFRQLKELQNPDVLLPWLRRIMVNTAIDHYRKNLKHSRDVAVETLENSLVESNLNEEGILAQLSAEHILQQLQQLPTTYRVVFGLYVLEGYSHREIGEKLHLAESTSRAHLAEANRLLRKALATQNDNNYARNRK
jgi:RNA polymerase sigma factor (sigma-70 family)